VNYSGATYTRESLGPNQRDACVVQSRTRDQGSKPWLPCLFLSLADHLHESRLNTRLSA
jgi:hypothetical protein